ncbi:hypothetical protein [Nocardioides marmorisolisilvae]|uniref:DUF4333 domain-containing protein n=1 Tax=Nocardioides marmorisolisilvae TaxID=1542737 RepID=A0A3N0DRV3_9ACTN|nr:hypothetical protein [Nocardioides marmorisolisilvae]RNL78355.1 hypothetical protein EFL95_04420 [Nocardioides marmorisolisilvae]
MAASWQRATLTGAALMLAATLGACGASAHETNTTSRGTYPDSAAAAKFAARVARAFQTESASTKTAYRDLDFTDVIRAHSGEVDDGDGTYEDYAPGRSLTVDDHGCTVTIEFEPTGVGTAPQVDDPVCN